MFRRKDPYSNQYPQTRSKLWIAIGAVFLIIILVIVIFSTGSSKNKQTNEKISVTQRFSNGSFAVSYPEGYEIDEAKSTSFSATFTQTGDQQDQSAPKDTIVISRFGKNGISMDSIKGLASSEKGLTTEERTISGRKALVTKETKKIDDRNSITDTIFYVYADIYVWKVEFTNSPGSKQQDYIEPIMDSFYPKDAELLKL